MSERLTPHALARAARGIAGSIDERRWQLADLALQARQDDVEGWADIIAAIVRRQARTIRSWAQTADFRHRLPQAYDLPFSFFEIASRLDGVLTAEDLDNALSTFAAEAGASSETFAAHLRNLADGHSTPVFESLRRVRIRLGRLGEAEQITETARSHIAQASDHLDCAMAELSRAS